ncbi:serine hydrolase family protein [Cryobacterium frigoriphilum]|uniref:Serine hydrolase family protein n=1 Tax=Cryobacterium frigoriphilum TaxID=1259150 RepID=A0A4R8ZZT8_9MICO|nr:serine hydrolase family protein [Cryobacterium frigoriphilum]
MKTSTTLDDAHSIRRVVIVPGYGAAPASHWFPWLREALAESGIEAIVVELPTPNDPQTSAWQSAVRAALGTPHESTWVVTHSLGGITALRVLAAITGEWRLGGLVLVAGFTGPLAALPTLDEYLTADVDVERLAPNIGVRVLIRSDNDVFVPPLASEQLAHRLDAEIAIQPGAGHFLAEDGVTALPLVLDVLRLQLR